MPHGFLCSLTRGEHKKVWGNPGSSIVILPSTPAFSRGSSTKCPTVFYAPRSVKWPHRKSRCTKESNDSEGGQKPLAT